MDTSDPAPQPPDAPPPETGSSIPSFVEEMRRFVIRMRGMAEAVHGEGAPTDRQKALLMDLEYLGPQTIPQLTRYRPVSRQRIQVLAQELMKAGLIVQRPNPASLRSHLLAVSERGRDLLRTLKQQEADGLRALNLPFTAEEWDALRLGMQRIRTALDVALKEEGFFR